MRPTRSAMAAKNGKPLPAAGPPHQKSPADYLNDLRRFLRLSWSQGLKSPYRGQFWRQLYGIWQQNPSRLMRYFRLCAWGEDFFIFREAMRRHKACLPAQRKEPEFAAAASGAGAKI
jgi:hypothetical protein